MPNPREKIAKALAGFSSSAINPRSGQQMEGQFFPQDQQLLGNRLRTRFQETTGDNYYLDPFSKNGGYWMQSPTFPQEVAEMMQGQNPSHFPPDIFEIVKNAGSVEAAKAALLQAGINPYKQESF